MRLIEIGEFARTFAKREFFGALLAKSFAAAVAIHHLFYGNVPPAIIAVIGFHKSIVRGGGRVYAARSFCV